MSQYKGPDDGFVIKNRNEYKDKAGSNILFGWLEWNIDKEMKYNINVTGKNLDTFNDFERSFNLMKCIIDSL